MNNFSFKTFLEQAFNHELKTLQELPKMSMYNQATHDQDIHKKAIRNGSFDAFGNNFLMNDMGVKELFKKILKQVENNETIDQQEKSDLIEMLEKDKNGHEDYISNNNFAPHTGSEEWHRMWIEVYNKWITWLKELGTNY